MSEPPSWDPEYQRRLLTPFERLRAVAWARSLWVYEAAMLGSQGWWWKLRWQMWRHFRGIDPFRLAAERPEGSLVYGETPPITIHRLLMLLPVNEQTVFVDLGCGRGYPVLTAASMGYRAVGIEMVPELVETAQKVAHKLAVPAEFRCGDALTDPLPEGSLYFVDATTWDEEARRTVGLKFADRPSQTLFAVSNWALAGEQFEELGELQLPVNWGITPCYLRRRR